LSSIVGAAWGVWHLPAFFVPGLNQNKLNLFTFCVFSFSMSILMAYVLNRNGYCTLLSVLIHNAGNSTSQWPLDGDLAWPTPDKPVFFAIFTLVVTVVMVLVVVDSGGRLGDVEAIESGAVSGVECSDLLE
jgi:hypothetical protein